MSRALSPRRASREIARRLALCAALPLAACSDRNSPVGPLASGTASPIVTISSPKSDRLATIEREGTRDVLYVQNADGTNRTRVSFRNVQDHVVGNQSLPVTDETILAMRRAKWSPDGQSLAVIVVPAAGTAQVVLVSADGRTLRTVSPNSQYLYGDVEWSTDSHRIAYAMSTGPFALSPDLFVTDLGPDHVTRVTTSGKVGPFDTFRFDPTGQRINYTERLGFADDGTNGLFRLASADLSTGTIAVRKDTLLGEPQGIARDGSWLLLLRWNAEQTRELVRVAVPPQRDIVLTTGDMVNAVLLDGDAEALVISPDLNDRTGINRTFRIFGTGTPNDEPPLLPTRRNVTWAAFARSSK
jgi:dipeptidyl aminopeptidase/acylaminoacyl peptidase